jgi:outer membrane protein assembly factor BamB
MRRSFGIVITLFFLIMLLPSFQSSQMEDSKEYPIIPSSPIIMMPSKGPMNSPWPMFKNDAGCSGLSDANTSRNPGILIWEFKASGEISTPVIDTAGNLYFTSGSGFLYCVYPNGTQRWRSPINTTGFTEAPALASDGTVYVHSLEGGLYSFDGSGNFNWYTDTGYQGNTPPLIGKDGNIIVAARNRTGNNPDNPILLSIYPNGTIYWTRDEPLHDTQFVSIQSNGTILMPQLPTYINMYLPNGTLKKQVTADGSDPRSSVTSAQNGTFYYCTFDGGLSAMDDTGSEKLWN